MDVNSLLETADKLGVIAGMIILCYAIWKKHLVPGWVYDQCEKRLVSLETLLNAHAARTEARVDTLEQERDKRYGPPA
jgi:hypothetical protein